MSYQTISFEWTRTYITSFLGSNRPCFNSSKNNPCIQTNIRKYGYNIGIQVTPKKIGSVRDVESQYQILTDTGARYNKNAHRDKGKGRTVDGIAPFENWLFSE